MYCGIHVRQLRSSSPARVLRIDPPDVVIPCSTGLTLVAIGFDRSARLEAKCSDQASPSFDKRARDSPLFGLIRSPYYGDQNGRPVLHRGEEHFCINAYATCVGHLTERPPLRTTGAALSRP